MLSAAVSDIKMNNWIFTLGTFCVVFIAETSCRQMCLSCQYVDNPSKQGIECASAPHNWTYGDTRMRCHFRCTITGHFDLKSGDPTYFFRGCSSSNEVGEDGCTEDHVKEYCSYSCVDEDYCNDRPFLKAPSLEEGSGCGKINVFVSLQILCAFVCLFLLYGSLKDWS